MTKYISIKVYLNTRSIGVYLRTQKYWSIPTYFNILEYTNIPKSIDVYLYT